MGDFTWETLLGSRLYMETLLGRLSQTSNLNSQMITYLLTTPSLRPQFTFTQTQSNTMTPL